ncbi:protein phosphatase 2C domain-containing protein [Halorientalis marina]|jgi:hypothetical protein|uniref:protein phosphatase 2C domain-containing protein n=1 Tax=Halorientalis marina TaxID=2931976 RepID=UPI001FF51549|nr:protein phosphatase 2C domain-containing protein [Halorientalis marina]
MTRSDPEKATVVGCAVEGPSHEGTELPCQDAWCSHRLPDGRFVIAVGDGLGSAAFSHDGSEIATERAAQVLKDRFETADSIDEATAQPIFERAFVEARSALARKAESRGDDLSDYATTLLAVVAGSSGAAGAAAGDGGAVFGLQDTYEPLVPPEEAVADLGAAHRTYPLTHDAWEDYYRFDYREDVDSVAVFSDGLSQWAWQGDHEANRTWFESAFALIEAAGDAGRAEQSLREALDNDNYRQSRDDKTLVMGTLDVADVEDQIEAEQGTDDIVSVWFRTVVGSVRAVTRVFAPAHRNRR